MAIGTIEIFMVLLIYAIPLIVVVYLIILVKRYIDAKARDSKNSSDFNDKITQLCESMDRVERKLDKIENILEKVSE